MFARCVMLLAGFMLAHGSSAAFATQPADLLITGATIVDGTGGPRYRADVAIRDGRISAISTDLRLPTRKLIVADGLMIAPGFIDVHNHTEQALATPAGRLNEAYIRQGVTTIVAGADGGLSPRQIRSLLNTFREAGIAPNIAFYVGHNAIRLDVLGDRQQRAPTAEELDRMQALVKEGMELGAVGLSTGLMYYPGVHASTDEVVELAKVVAPYGGIYDSHVRDPHHALLQSNWEAIEIGRRAGVPVKLTHLTTPGRNHNGLMREVIRMIESARANGIVVVADQYPYAGVATMKLVGTLSVRRDIPVRGPEDVFTALRDPQKRARIRAASLSGGEAAFSPFKTTGPDHIRILVSSDFPQYEGKFIGDVAAERNVDGFEAIAQLLLEARHDIIVTVGGMYEEDLRELLGKPWNMIASDGYASDSKLPAPKFSSAHPRSTGTFPRVLGVYSRDLKLLSLEEAVRKMTSLPAAFVRLPERGRILPGQAADLVVFDPEAIADRSTWQDPEREAEGVIHVIVNGRLVLENGAMTGRAPGAFVRAGGERPERLGAD